MEGGGETKESSLGAFGIATGAVARFLVTRPVLGFSRAGAGAAKAEEALRDEVDLAGAIFPGFGKTAIDLRRVAIFSTFVLNDANNRQKLNFLNRY